MLQRVFGGMMVISLVGGMISGSGEATVFSMLNAASEAVQTAIALTGAYAFFCGLLNIVRKAGVAEGLGKALFPALKRLFGDGLPADALEPVTMNLTANLLGLGNAATPIGIEAARRMGKGNGTASNALCLFLVINASSVQLFPTSVIALRAAAGSADPTRIVLPTLIATSVSTAVGIVSCKCAERIL